MKRGSIAVGVAVVAVLLCCAPFTTSLSTSANYVVRKFIGGCQQVAIDGKTPNLLVEVCVCDLWVPVFLVADPCIAWQDPFLTNLWEADCVC